MMRNFIIDNDDIQKAKEMLPKLVKGLISIDKKKDLQYDRHIGTAMSFIIPYLTFDEIVSLIPRKGYSSKKAIDFNRLAETYYYLSNHESNSFIKERFRLLSGLLEKIIDFNPEESLYDDTGYLITSRLASFAWLSSNEEEHERILSYIFTFGCKSYYHEIKEGADYHYTREHPFYYAFAKRWKDYHPDGNCLPPCKALTGKG